MDGTTRDKKILNQDDVQLKDFAFHTNILVHSLTGFHKFVQLRIFNDI